MNERMPVRHSRRSGGHNVARANRKFLPAQAHHSPAWVSALVEPNWVPWAIVALAAGLRVLLLGIKPPHFDEGMNGWLVDQIVKTGFYRYDPANEHGPLHFYVLFLSQTLFGRNVWALRLPVVLVSTACVYLAMRFEPLVGRTVSRFAALALAVSPGFIFYGRYSIHEVWLQFFSMLFILGLLGMWRCGTRKYLWFSTAALAGMILTKETYIIHVGCVLLALPVAMISNKLNRVPDARPAKQEWGKVDFLVVMAVASAAIAFFYSGTFFYWEGIKGLYQCFAMWIETAQAGRGHEKNEWYWLMLIGRYEWPIALGLLGSVLCQFYKSASLRYIAIYGVGTFITYTILPYKTPWCIISAVWPFAFLFGAVLVSLASRQLRLAWVTSIVVICVSLGSAISLNYFRCTSDAEPYVYVQTYNDVFKLTRPVLALAKTNPANFHLTGHIIRSSAHPLPWMLGEFPRIQYYENRKTPANPDGDLIVVEERRIPEIESKLRQAYYTSTIRIRAYQDTSKVYFNAKTFMQFFPGRSPDFPEKDSL